ncbi:Beta-barrel assembly-enhancing protease [Pedobacter sp. Bi27]|uniref:tetratricopeptide repeat protein n=1 Tax=unclassified Pedobacter TaxID=2628915 RepID=UPI001D52159F|nr:MULTISPECIES: tetratricopeptide repeat protein [unclassified Pedobacter]CAH0143779.1 Beta-barrel assembly-enhancing protease [Pedobacter sp. Bi36]CAH0199624.1 Beta-barrel assembly-enhancing protease [Pedobacter sp. Bi126]CAH0258371.1 Beta-barrel assembly-enhancing protease [Pedobacter sp. Bi27]
MQNCLKISLTALIFVSFNAVAQKSQILIARNAVGKLQASIANKEDEKKQLSIITEGLKSIESAEKDNKTKNWSETWSIKSYLTSFASIIDTDPNNANKFYDSAVEAVAKAKSLDRYDDNGGLIKASNHNILIKKQEKGNEAFFNNDFKEAFADLKEVCDNFPADTTLALNTAICALNIQSYDESLTYFKRAKENGIRNPSVFQKMAQMYVVKSENETAIKTLEDGLVLNPFNRFLTNDYINLLLDTENYSKAQGLIENNLKVEKGNKLLYFLYGYLQQVAGNNATAILAYDKALSTDQNYFDALYQLSLAYINTANETLSKNDADKTEKYKGLINRAQFALQRANEINPNDKKTVQLLIDIYTKKGVTNKVQELNRKLQEL